MNSRRASALILLLLTGCTGGQPRPMDDHEAELRMRVRVEQVLSAHGRMSEPGYPQFHSDWNTDGYRGGIWVMDSTTKHIVATRIDAGGAVEIRGEAEYRLTRSESVAAAKAQLLQEARLSAWLGRYGSARALAQITVETMREDTHGRTWHIRDATEQVTVHVSVLPQGQVEVGMLVR